MKIIAESAFNHNGDINYLQGLALAAKESRADYFTCQVMHAPSFCVADYSKYDIYITNSFDEKTWSSFFTWAKNEGIEVIPCVLEETSLKWCLGAGFDFIKIHATDIVNIPMLKQIAERPDVKVILETQCATHQDIEIALDIIGSQVVCLMHGFSNYPTEIEDTNLNSLDYLKSYFNYPIGLADHTLDTSSMPLMALAKGVDYLEKHITLSRNDRHYDWQVSLNPDEFKIMVCTVSNYTMALGKFGKHPVAHEKDYRPIMYKKVLNDSSTLMRADFGKDYSNNLFDNLDEKRVGVALVARLKSQRMPQKVLKPLLDGTMLSVLYRSLERSQHISDVFLATSSLSEDEPLRGLFKNTFLGHDISVIDRMLTLARKQNWGGIFRVTGDNPLTSPELIDQMIELFWENNLDYVRANNVPFGMSAELFSTSYLFKNYMEMSNPMHSEYLSWFVLNDPKSRKGCINLEGDERIRFVNLSVDYPEDYNRVATLLIRAKIKSLDEIELNKIINNLDLEDIESADKGVKLPEHGSIRFEDYLNLINDVKYVARTTITI